MMHSSHEMVVTFLRFCIRQSQTCQLKLFGCLPHPGFFTCFCNHPKQLHLKNTKKAKNKSYVGDGDDAISLFHLPKHFRLGGSRLKGDIIRAHSILLVCVWEKDRERGWWSDPNTILDRAALTQKKGIQNVAGVLCGQHRWSYEREMPGAGVKKTFLPKL